MNTQLIELFCNLVKIDSPTGEEQKVAEFIVAYLKKYGIRSTRDKRGNVLATISGEGEPLLLSAHMDTVEPGRGIKPIIENGYIVTDGTTILGGDNKLGLAGILYAVDQIQSRPHVSLELVFTVSEESGIMGSEDIEYTQLHSKKGYCFDITEPVGTIALTSFYYERFDITFTGLASHASRPHLAKNVLPAVELFLRKTRIGEVAPERTLVNIGKVLLGDARNTVPGQAVIQGEIRSLSEKNLLRVKETCQKLLEEIEKKTGVQISQTWVRENEGYSHTSSAAKAFIRDTVSVCEKLGIQSLFQKGGGLSDANSYNKHGILCLNMGDGGQFAHAREERIKISEFDKLAKLIIELTLTR